MVTPCSIVSAIRHSKNNQLITTIFSQFNQTSRYSTHLFLFFRPAREKDLMMGAEPLSKNFVKYFLSFVVLDDRNARVLRLD
jgi:hypothetical protein